MNHLFVKDKYLILKRYSSVSLSNFNSIAREKSERERGYRSWISREAENRDGSVSWGIPYLKGKTVKHNLSITNGFILVSWPHG